MLTQHIRHALRLLRNSPGFTLVAVCTLAIGIGANTAIFSVVDVVLLRPLPYPATDRLVALWEARDGMNEFQVPGLGGIRPSVSPANLVDYNAETTTFEGFAGYNLTSRNLIRSGPPQALVGESVTWNYLAVLGMQPALGRAFRPEEDRIGAHHVVIITDELWRSTFSASPAILGRQIVLDGEAHDVIGVMPPEFEAISGFRFPAPVRFLVPAAYPDSLLVNRNNSIANVIGRMKPGVALAQAQADLDRISADLARAYPASNAPLRATVAPLRAELVRHLEPSLLILLGAAGLVLLVACVNVANLLLVRAVGQRRDVAIRMALGATRRHILFELLARGLVLGVLSGGAGLLCGMWTRDILIALAPATIPRLQSVSLSGPVLVATLFAAIASGVLAGLIPAVQAAGRTATTLSHTALTASASPDVLRWRGLLVAAEIATAMMLTIGAGLLVRSLWLLNRVPVGFDADRVLVMGISLPQAKYSDAVAQITFFDALSARVKALPGVQAVAFASQFPLANQNWGSDYGVETAAGAVRGTGGFQTVSPGYFATLGIPLIRGRVFEDGDRFDSPPVVVISETLARRLPGSGIGLDLDWNLGGNGQPRRSQYPAAKIVGVVGEIRREGRLAAREPQVYLAAAQARSHAPSSFAVRAGDAGALAAAVQRSVWAIDPEQTITRTRTLDQLLRGGVADRRFDLALMLSFAVLALGLAMVGCYAVVAYAAAQRTREIGIRLAFGATRREVTKLIVKSEMRWVLLGVVAGVLGALALTRLMKGLLFEIAPTDPWTFAVTAAAILIVALGASILPARRAAHIDPMTALRVE